MPLDERYSAICRNGLEGSLGSGDYWRKVLVHVCRPTALNEKNPWEGAFAHFGQSKLSLGLEAVSKIYYQVTSCELLSTGIGKRLQNDQNDDQGKRGGYYAFLLFGFKLAVF